MTIKSQRLVTFIVLIVAAVLMALGGGQITLSDSITNTVISLAAPFLLIFTTLSNLYAFLDARIAEGKLQAGDILGMLTMKEWWIAMIANVAGLGQIFGYKIISADEQVILVNVALAFVTVLLQSFTNREATDSNTLEDNTGELPGTG